MESIFRHEYPAIPDSADDEVSNLANIRLLEEEWAKTSRQDPEKLKTLWIRTHNTRRATILKSEDSTSKIIQKYPMLKRSTYVSLVFMGSTYLPMYNVFQYRPR